MLTLVASYEADLRDDRAGDGVAPHLSGYSTCGEGGNNDVNYSTDLERG
jgi:hypothetical protein